MGRWTERSGHVGRQIRPPTAGGGTSTCQKLEVGRLPLLSPTVSVVGWSQCPNTTKHTVGVSGSGKENNWKNVADKVTLIISSTLYSQVFIHAAE